MKKTFISDNTAPADVRILKILEQANEGYESSYGYDIWTERAEELVKREFGRQAQFFPVLTGTGANVVSLASVLAPFQAVLCAETAHINVDECGAPERFLGSKIIGIPTADGKLRPADLKPYLDSIGFEHHSQPYVISVSQVTETGIAYSPDELADLSCAAQKYNMIMHIDGSRLANAAAYLGCSLAEAAAGADIISLGGTKNGMMLGEAVVVINPDIAQNLKYYRKQGMQLFSKMRYVSAQFVPYLEDKIWLENALKANSAAKKLEKGLREKGFSPAYPVNGNGVFVRLPGEAVKKAQEKFSFYVWDDAEEISRLMCSFCTSDSDIEEFLDCI